MHCRKVVVLGSCLNLSQEILLPLRTYGLVHSTACGSLERSETLLRVT